jgi:hypothetical protein
MSLRDRAWSARQLEASAVRRLIEHRFTGNEDALWLVLGDLNDPQAEPGREQAIAPLTKEFAVDLCGRLPEFERWTCYEPSSASYSRLNYMLASPQLAKPWPMRGQRSCAKGWRVRLAVTTGQECQGLESIAPEQAIMPPWSWNLPSCSLALLWTVHRQYHARREHFISLGMSPAIAIMPTAHR